MARPKKETAQKHKAHQVSFPAGMWEEVGALLQKGENHSGVIQGLLRAWVKQRKAEKAGEALPEVLERLRRLEPPTAPDPGAGE